MVVVLRGHLWACSFSMATSRERSKRRVVSQVPVDVGEPARPVEPRMSCHTQSEPSSFTLRRRSLGASQ